VDIACDHFFSDAAFARQQHRRIGLRDARRQGKEIAAGLIAGDDAVVIHRFRQTITRYVFEQCFRLKRLEKEIAGAGTHRLDRAIDIGKGRHQHDREMRIAGPNFLEQGDSVHRHHAHIAYDQCDRLRIQ